MQNMVTHTRTVNFTGGFGIRKREFILKSFLVEEIKKSAQNA